MKNDRRLQDMIKITGVLADQAMLPVVKASENVRRIEAQIERLATHRQRLARSAEDLSLAATMLNQADRLRKEQADALVKLAAAQVSLEHARQMAAKAVGRNQAAEAISKQRIATAKRDASRRLLRGG